ncbi:MAG TPA: MFS transporter [Pirellulales bacterium]|nr:MFS transporter [Pirellulales bacterium]
MTLVLEQAVADFCPPASTAAEPLALGRQATSARRDLQAIMADGAACSVMIGIGENYLAPFALALGMGEVIAGLITSVPFLAGAVLQMISPAAIRRLGSHRRWVVACVVCQALSFLPLAVAAVIGTIPVAVLFLLAAVYWGSGMASGPAWSSWVDTLIPERIRARYFGRRARLGQAGTLIGFAGGGLWLQYSDWLESPLAAFAILFLIAAVCRFISAALLSSQSEPRRPIEGAHEARPRDMIHRLRHAGDGRLLVYLWAMQAAAQVASPFFTPFLLGTLHFSYAKFMLVVSTSLLAKAVALPTLGALAERFGAMRLLWIGGLIVIPLPTLWIISQATPFLLAIQLAAGAAWATYELGAFLLFFEAIDARQRIGMLTLYNLGYAAATVAGSLIGGAILAVMGENQAGYLVVFAASCAARILTLPLLRRVRKSTATRDDDDRPTTIRYPAAGNVEELAINRAA